MLLDWRLEAYILLLGMKVRRDGFPEQYAIPRGQFMTPEFKGLGHELRLLKSDLADGTRKLRQSLSGLRDDVNKEFAEAQGNVDETNKSLDEIRQFNKEVKSGLNTSEQQVDKKTADVLARPDDGWFGKRKVAK